MTTESGISGLIQFLLSNPSAIAALLGTYAPAIGAAWLAANFLNRREINDYKRRLEFDTNRHSRDIENMKKMIRDKVPIIDESFPMMNFDAVDPGPNIVPQAARHYRDFHVIAHLDSPDWATKRITHEKVFAEWFGDSLQSHPILKQGYTLVAQSAQRECMLWSGATVKTVESHPIIKQMYPFVIVRLVPHQSGADPTTDELFGFIGWLRYWYQAMPSTRFTIQKMVRTEDKAYLRGYFEFDRLKVDGTLHEKYYLLRQVVVLKSDTHTHTIFTGLPNHEFSDPYFRHLRDWWDVFRVVRD